MKTRQLRQNRLSLRIALITLLSAVAGILGLLRLSYNTNRIAETYDHIMERDYRNVVYMEEVTRKMHEHQAVLYHHLTEPDEREREELEQSAIRIETELTDMLIEFGASMNGTSYESYFHNIYSGLVGYFNNVSLIFSFNNRGDMATAAYYMHVSLEGNIRQVNANLDELDDAIAQDMRISKEVNDERIAKARIETIGIMLIVAVFAAVCMFLCTRVSAEMVSHDLLTGVANFDSLLKQGSRLERGGRLRGYTALAVSLKNFKFINQEYGSTAGDEVLVQYAAQMQAQLEGGEVVARNGGDNFLVLLRSEHRDRFLESLGSFTAKVGTGSERFELPLFSRCGVAPAREFSTINVMIDACQIALSATRRPGAQDVVYFETVMYERMQHKKKTLELYRKALENQEFCPYYQPKVDMLLGRLAGAEALARWIHDGKVVPPGDFIPFLEEEGELTKLDFYIFDRVCADQRAWLDAGMAPVRVSSNFSKLHLKNARFAEEVLRTLEKYRLDGQYVQIEITESSGYEDYDALQRFAARMHENGVSISIDDFGTGYSSLSMLKDLDADVVKLDRSFLFGVGSDDGDGDGTKEKLVANIIRMILDLDRTVICEGVETARQVKFLTEAGCIYAQGFYYDRPLEKQAFEARLKDPTYHDAAV